MAKKTSVRIRIVGVAALFGALVGVGGAASFANTILDGPVKQYPEYNHANQNIVMSQDSPGEDGGMTFAMAGSDNNGFHNVGAQALLKDATDDTVRLMAPWSYHQWSSISEVYWTGNVRGSGLYYMQGLTRVTAGMGFATLESTPTPALWMPGNP